MAPGVKDDAWKHIDMIDGFMYCKYCKKLIRGGEEEADYNVIHQFAQAGFPEEPPKIEQSVLI
jgi:hypothetical protein